MLTEEEEEEGTASSGASQLRLLGWYVLLSALIATANGTASAALNYVNMATKLVFKNAKIVTVMLLGTLLFRKRYLAVEYGYMLLVACGLVVFFLAASAPIGSNPCTHHAPLTAPSTPSTPHTSLQPLAPVRRFAAPAPEE